MLLGDQRPPVIGGGPGLLWEPLDSWLLPPAKEKMAALSGYPIQIKNTPPKSAQLFGPLPRKGKGESPNTGGPPPSPPPKKTTKKEQTPRGDPDREAPGPHVGRRSRGWVNQASGEARRLA